MYVPVGVIIVLVTLLGVGGFALVRAALDAQNEARKARLDLAAFRERVNKDIGRFQMSRHHFLLAFSSGDAFHHRKPEEDDILDVCLRLSEERLEQFGFAQVDLEPYPEE